MASSNFTPIYTRLTDVTRFTARRVGATHSQGYIVHASLTISSPWARGLSRSLRSIARHKPAGRIQERDGKLYATPSAGTEQRAAV